MRTALAQLRPAWLRGVPGAVAGLFLARVALETAQRPWPGPVVLGGGLLAAVGGFALSRHLSRHPNPSDARHPPFGVPHWPLSVLLIYVLWPRRDLLVAASAATLATLAYVLARGERSRPPEWAEGLVDGVTFVVFSLAYLVTAAPDVLPADAGEFQLAAALLGVAHPPGYPLYTLIGHLFIRLIPWGTPAYRLNLLSGLLAAGTLVLMARATRVWARRLGASPLATIGSGLATALTLGAATTFWAQATIANVRTLAVFLAALALYALSRLATATEQREADRALILLSVGLGLGGGHYPPLAFVGLFFVFYALLVNPGLIVQPHRWWRPLVVGVCAFLLPLVYLPIRGAMDAPLAPEGLDTLSGFLHHFLARGFAGDMFAFANPVDLPHRLALVPTLFQFQFNTGLLVAALLGLLGLAWRDWRLFVMLAGSLVAHTFVTITYRAPQTVEYLMPAYLPVAAAAGLLPSLFPHSRTATLLCSLILVAGLLNGWFHAPSFLELAQDRTARETVEPLLHTAPPGALLLADWRWAMPLRYLREVEGQRPDIELQYVWPVAGEDYRDVWLERVQDAGPERPILLTHAYEFDGYTTEPWESGFLIRPRALAEPTAPLVPIGRDFGGQVRLIGYSLQGDRLHPGQTTELVLAWQPTKPLTTPPSFTLRLVDDKGQLRAQADRVLSTDVAAGELRFERLVVPLYPTLSPGRYQMTLGAYIVTDAGFETLPLDDEKTSITLAEVELAPLRTRPFTRNRQTLPFQDGPTLVGVDYDRSAPEVLRVYLHWQGSAQTGLEVRVRTGDGAQATASLVAIPPTAYQTIAVDLPLPDPQGSSRAIGSPRLSLTDAQGGTILASGPWGLPLKEVRLPTPTNGTRFVPLGSEMAVIGAKAKPVGPGETMALDVTLVALRPLTGDDATSVRLADGDGRWLDTHDCQPGLGAVPTLKWIRGSRVVDRHLLEIPEEFSGDSVRATMVAYERFRMVPLPSMDRRFSEAPLGTWDIP
jgi:hypothetical protein